MPCLDFSYIPFQINARDRANQLPLYVSFQSDYVLRSSLVRHRAATTGSTAFISLLLHPPEGSPKPRLNTGDRVGNTPLHLALESGHAEAAVMLIEAGADRGRVSAERMAVRISDLEIPPSKTQMARYQKRLKA